MRKSLTSEHFNALALRLKAGDQNAGKELFDYWSPLLFRFFMIRLTNRGKAEDLVQDVFLKLVARIDTFDTNAGNFTAWFWQVAKNTLKDYYREKKEGIFRMCSRRDRCRGRSSGARCIDTDTGSAPRAFEFLGKRTGGILPALPERTIISGNRGGYRKIGRLAASRIASSHAKTQKTSS